jgi:hypothetical protein
MSLEFPKFERVQNGIEKFQKLLQPKWEILKFNKILQIYDNFVKYHEILLNFVR